MLALLVLAFWLASASWRQVITNPWDDVLLGVYARVAAESAQSEAVLVAIDDESLAAVGAWPWPRAIHGQLIERLSSANAIAYDIAFIGHKHTVSDQVLVDAVERHGNVVLPLVPEPDPRTGLLTTLLPFEPLPALARLGHIENTLENDRLQTVYLKAGKANAEYPVLGLAALAAEADELPEIQGVRALRKQNQSPSLWVRDFGNSFVPILGSPEATLSAVDVLSGKVPDDAFSGKTVFVGAMSNTIAVPVPVVGLDKPLFDVQIQQTIYDSIKQDLQLVRSGNGLALLHALICLCIAGVPVFFRDWRVGLTCATAAVTWLFIVPLIIASAFNLWVLQGPGLLACVVVAIAIVVDRVLRRQRQLVLRTKNSTDDIEPIVMEVFASAPLQGYFGVGLVQLDFFDRYMIDKGKSRAYRTLRRVNAAINDHFGSQLLRLDVFSDYSFVLCVHSDNEKAFLEAFQALSSVVEGLNFTHRSSTIARVVTVSGGAGGEDLALIDQPELLLGNAEVALKQAIAQSRNQTIVFK